MPEADTLIFSEVQRFGLWLRVVLAFLVPLTVGVMVSAGASEGRITELSFILPALACILLMAAIAVLFWMLKLETQVRSDGVYVRFYPLHIRHKKIGAGELEECFARQYRPILEYGGWGIRCGIKGGRAYNVSGNKGVQLVLKSGRRLLIGSQRPDELAEAITSIMASI